jgi:branched-chain amino acid transport system substrate-binding protein
MPVSTRSATIAFWLLSGLAMPAWAQMSGDVVKIGILTDMSSVYSDTTGMGSVIAAQMAVEDMGGKAGGKPVQVIYADHQNDATVGAAIAREWLDTEKVDMIGDVPTSSVALVVQQIVRDRDKVLLMSGAGSSELTGTACSPNGIQWTYDSYAQANVAARSMVQRGGKSWFFITADYAFGASLERDASTVVSQMGGTILGSVRHPLNNADFSSMLLEAQTSRADVVGLADAGGDSGNAIKQMAEYGLQSGGQRVVPLLIDALDIRTLGLQTAQGMILAESWYWDLNDETRAFANRFMARTGKMPSAYQAGMYSATRAYLQAIDATGTDAADPVLAKMKATPINDMFAHGGTIREDGRMVHDYYLFQVKTPAASEGPFDVYSPLATVPGDEAFRPLDDGGCPLIRRE